MMVNRVNSNVRESRQIFSDVWTEEGLCFTYNSLSAAELYRDGCAAPVRSPPPITPL